MLLLPLDVVVLQADSLQGFHLAQKYEGILAHQLRDMKQVTCGMPVDIQFPATEEPPNDERNDHNVTRYLVYDCSPAMCGVVTVDTAIITFHPDLSPAVGLSSDALSPNRGEGTKPTSERKILMLSAFAQPLAGPQQQDPPLTLRTILDICTAASIPCQAKVDINAIWTLLNEVQAHDLFAVALVTPATLAGLQAFNSSWVMVNVVGHEQRPLRLICPQLSSLSKPSVLAAEMMQDSALYVYPALGQRLGLASEVASINCTVNNKQLSPPKAQRVTLHPVRTPALMAPPAGLLDTAVCHYFATGRHVHEGDIVAVPLSPCLGPLLARLEWLAASLDDSAPGEPMLLLYKVGTIEGPTAQELISSAGLVYIGAATQLVQGSLVSAAAPPLAACFMFPVTSPALVFAALLPMLPAAQQICDVVRSALRTNAVSNILVKGHEADLVPQMVQYAAVASGLHFLSLNAHVLDLSTLPDLLAMAARNGPALVHIRHWDTLIGSTREREEAENSVGQDAEAAKVVLALQDAMEAAAAALDSSNSLTLVLSCGHDIPLAVRNAMKFEVEVNRPAVMERTHFLSFICQLVRCALPLQAELDTLATQMAGLSYADMAHIIHGAVQRAVARQSGQVWGQDHSTAREIGERNAMLLRAGLMLTVSDMEAELKKFKKSRGVDGDAGGIAKVEWEDIGGLAQAKEEILDVIELPLKRPYLFADGMHRRSGVLLYGPPGCGKTLLAKAVASQCSLQFISVKGPELVNMYVGESERNVREVFTRARSAAPCIVFFDELDSVAPRRGATGDSGGVMDRVVSQLLAELDGAAADAKGVFILGATNRPDLLDSALLRPGRLDRLVYVGCPETHSQQLLVLQAQLRKFPLSPDVDLQSLVAQCPLTLSGADFKALGVDALMLAMHRSIGNELLSDSNDTPGQPIVPDLLITMADLEEARDKLTPSISAADLAKYTTLRRQYEMQQTTSSQLP